MRDELLKEESNCLKANLWGSLVTIVLLTVIITLQVMRINKINKQVIILETAVTGLLDELSCRMGLQSNYRTDIEIIYDCIIQAKEDQRIYSNGVLVNALEIEWDD